MLSIRPGSWFLSPLFVLGSADPLSSQLSIRFQRSQFQNLSIRLVNTAEETVIQQDLGTEVSECEIPMKCWPKGKYRLFLEDEEKVFSYQVLIS